MGTFIERKAREQRGGNAVGQCRAECENDEQTVERALTVRAPGMKAEVSKQWQGDAERQRGAQFCRDAEGRLVQAGPLLAGFQLVRIGKVSDHGAQHEVARALRKPLRRGERQHQSKAIRRERQQAKVDSCLNQFGQHPRARLAKREADPLPQWRRKQSETILEQE